MKKIGFIDLYDPDIKEKLETNNEIEYAIYIFNETHSGFELQKKVETSSDESLKEAADFHLSLPIGLLNFRILEFPFTDKEKLRKVIPFELDNLIIGGVNNVVYDFTVFDGSGDNHKVLAAYIEKKMLGDIISKFISIGIDPRIITSLESGRIFRDKKENIASELLAPEIISGEERINSAIQELRSHTLNFRKGEYAYTKDIEKSGKKIKLTLMLLISLAFVINATLAFKIITSNNEISSLKHQIRSLYSSLFPADKKITDELYQMKSHMKNIREKADMIIGVNPLDLMMNLSLKKSQGIIMEEINLEKEIITMKGEAASMSDLDAMKKNLLEKYDNVSVSDMKPLSENKILFTIIIKDKPL